MNRMVQPEQLTFLLDYIRKKIALDSSKSILKQFSFLLLFKSKECLRYFSKGIFYFACMKLEATNINS